jgi:hypothetical protein
VRGVPTFEQDVVVGIAHCPVEIERTAALDGKVEADLQFGSGFSSEDTTRYMERHTPSLRPCRHQRRNTTSRSPQWLLSGQTKIPVRSRDRERAQARTTAVGGAWLVGREERLSFPSRRRVSFECRQGSYRTAICEGMSRPQMYVTDLN